MRIKRARDEKFPFVSPSTRYIPAATKNFYLVPMPLPSRLTCYQLPARRYLWRRCFEKFVQRIRRRGGGGGGWKNERIVPCLKNPLFLFAPFFSFSSRCDRLTCSCKFRIIRFSHKIEFSSKLLFLKKRKSIISSVRRNKTKK